MRSAHCRPLLAALLAFSLFGCGKAAETELKLDELTAAGGDYAYREIAYGAPPAEVGKALGVDLGAPDISGGPVDSYNVKAGFTLDGVPFYLSLHFKDGGFNSLSFQAQGEGVPDLYLKTAKELTELYGVSTWKADRKETGTGTTESYRWAELEGVRTALGVSLQTTKADGGEAAPPRMYLTLDLLPDGDPPATLTPGTPPPDVLPPF